MRRGLVVGKFMPLHRGHQFLIETALAHVDELTVVVYDVAIADRMEKLMPIEKRLKWINDLYPQIHNLVALPDPLPGDYATHDAPKYAEAYADQVRFLGPFTHVFSSEAYGAPYAEALGAEHVMVDEARRLMPISGTEFREDMFGERAYVDPLVYRSLIQKVVFVGTESTGKSTLAERMAGEYDTACTNEYGRTLWIEKIDAGVTPTFHDLLLVGQTQYQQEQAAALHANKYLFCDTNAWTTMLWSEMYHGIADARLVELAKKTKDEYIWFLCGTEFGWLDDGYRELKGSAALDFQDTNRRKLVEWGIDFYDVAGPLEQRVQQVKDILDYPTVHTPRRMLESLSA